MGLLITHHWHFFGFQWPMIIEGIDNDDQRKWMSFKSSKSFFKTWFADNITPWAPVGAKQDYLLCLWDTCPWLSILGLTLSKFGLGAWPMVAPLRLLYLISTVSTSSLGSSLFRLLLLNDYASSSTLYSSALLCFLFLFILFWFICILIWFQAFIRIYAYTVSWL